MEDLLTWEIKDENSLKAPRSYKGEFKLVRVQLQDKINKLIKEFEDKYNVLVCLGEFRVDTPEHKLTLQLIIDLDNAKFP